MGLFPIFIHKKKSFSAPNTFTSGSLAAKSTWYSGSQEKEDNCMMRILELILSLRLKMSRSAFRPYGTHPQCYLKVFVCNTAPFPQSCLITHRRAADLGKRPPVPIHTFLSNVVLEALRVVNQGSCFHKPTALAVGLLTY